MKFVAKVCILMISILTILGGILYAASKGGLTPRFLLQKVKVKVGTTQYLSSVLEGNVNLNNLESSDTGVIRILENGNLRAVGTGISTLTYTYKNDKDEDVEIYCFVEVTRDESTYAEVNGVSTMKIKLSLVLDGVTTVVDSNKGAIPTFPEFKREGLVFDGWYKSADYTNKVGERDRFGSDTTLYGRWLTKEEADALNTKVFTSSFFDDISNHWGKFAIESVTNLGLFNGVSERTFGPEIAMTRAMTVAVLGRLDGADVTNKKSGIQDVKEGSYYDGYLAWAIENKIVNDVENGNFRPNDEITREEMAIYMANYIRFKGYKYDLTIAPGYTDELELSEEGRQATKMLYNIGIMQGVGDGTFAPKHNTTRAQIAQIFFNYYNFSMKYKW